MVFRFVSGSLLVLAFSLVPVSRPTARLVVPASSRHRVERAFSRRGAASDEDSPGEFVHAIQLGHADRPLDIVQA